MNDLERFGLFFKGSNEAARWGVLSNERPANRDERRTGGSQELEQISENWKRELKKKWKKKMKQLV